MRHVIVFLIALAALPFVASAHPQSACTQPTWQFVGMTSEARDGLQTRIQRNRTCEQEYPGARVCTSKEYGETPGLQPHIGRAYIDAEFRENTGTNLIDWGGLIGDAKSFDCLIGANGLLLVGDGFTIVDCRVELAPTACCALQP